MATSWTLSYLSGTWISAYVIDNPSNDINISSISTRVKSQSYTGSNLRTITSTKNNYDDIELEWMFVLSSSNLFSTASGVKGLQLLMDDGNKIKITMDEGTIIEGFLINYNKNKLVKHLITGKQYYDVSATIDVTGIT